MGKSKTGPTGVGPKIKELLSQKVSYREIERRLGVRRATIAYHARRMGKPLDEKANRRYNWTEIQAFYDTHTWDETVEQFGVCKASIHKAITSGRLSHRG